MRWGGICGCWWTWERLLSQQADAQYVQMARAWLNQGAAGIYVPTPALEKIDGGAHIALLLQQLRALTNSFPGERVLLADGAAQKQDAMLQNGLAKYAQLTASAPLGATDARGSVPTVAALRQEWMAALGNTSESVDAAPAATTAPAGKHAKGQTFAAARNRVTVAVDEQSAAEGGADAGGGRPCATAGHGAGAGSDAAGLAVGGAAGVWAGAGVGGCRQGTTR